MGDWITYIAILFGAFVMSMMISTVLVTAYSPVIGWVLRFWQGKQSGSVAVKKTGRTGHTGYPSKAALHETPQHQGHDGHVTNRMVSEVVPHAPSGVSAHSVSSGMAPDFTFIMRVAGVSFHNPDGISRLGLIRQLRPGMAIYPDREPDNSHDENAIRLMSRFGQIGYVPADMAKILHLCDFSHMTLRVYSIKCFDATLAGCLIQVTVFRNETLMHPISLASQASQHCWTANLPGLTDSGPKSRVVLSQQDKDKVERLREEREMCAYDREHFALNDDGPRADIYAADWGNTLDDFDSLDWETWLSGPDDSYFDSFERNSSEY